MNNFAYTIILGVFAGVFTAGILFLISNLFKNSFVPWYRSLMYQGIKIDGKWFSYSLPLQKIVLELTQVCEKITGNATYVRESEDDAIDTIRTFDVQGEIGDRFLILNLKHVDPRRLGFVTLLLQVVGDGTHLKGISSGYNPATHEIDASLFSYYRSEKKAKKQGEAIRKQFGPGLVKSLKGKEHWVLPIIHLTSAMEAQAGADDAETIADETGEP